MRLYIRVIGRILGGKQGVLYEGKAHTLRYQRPQQSTTKHITSAIFGTTLVLGVPLSETWIENHCNLSRNRHAGNRLLYKDPIPQSSTCSLTESSSKPVEPSSLPASAAGSTKPARPCSAWPAESCSALVFVPRLRNNQKKYHKPCCHNPHKTATLANVETAGGKGAR